MKPNIDQITIASSIIQILKKIQTSNDLNDGSFYDYIEGEILNLDGILTTKERSTLLNNIQDIYLIIKNINNG